MQSQQNRKNNKIFKLMSLTIGTRSPSQCRYSVCQNLDHITKSLILILLLDKKESRKQGKELVFK